MKVKTSLLVLAAQLLKKEIELYAKAIKIVMDERILEFTQDDLKDKEEKQD